jgi:chromosome segregation ATPase
MLFAMFLMGLLFGVALAVTLALFAVLAMDGRFADNVVAAARFGRDRLTGRLPRAEATTVIRSPESDARLRALQEEIRVQQRLLEQARVEREGHTAEVQQLQLDLTSLREANAGCEQRIGERDAALRESTAVAARAREELALANAELARARREAKDLETELGVARSGAGLAMISAEIARLTAERDALQARLQSMGKAGCTGTDSVAAIR